MFNDNGSFLLALFEFFIFFAWIMCVFYVFADIFRSHDMGGGAKTVWCLFVIFVPFLGVLVYLIARGGGMTERTMEQQQRMQDQQAEYVRSVVATSGGGSSRSDRVGQATPRRRNDHPGRVRPVEGEGSRHHLTAKHGDLPAPDRCEHAVPWPWRLHPVSSTVSEGLGQTPAVLWPPCPTPCPYCRETGGRPATSPHTPA